MSALPNSALDGVLIGLDILSRFDLMIAADDFVIGLFPAGRAPHFPGEALVPISVQNEGRSLQVRAMAPGANDRFYPLVFIIDTGAVGSMIDVREGLKARFRADVDAVTNLRGALGAVETRGEFILAPLMLEQYSAGDVRVWTRDGATDGVGLLGMDVLGAARTVISYRDQTLRFHRGAQRPSTRSRRHDGTPCVDGAGAQAPCVAVALHPGQTPPELCIAAPGYVGQRLELAVRLYSEHGEPLLGRAGTLRVNTVASAAPRCLRSRRQVTQALAEAHSAELLAVRVGADAAWACGAGEACFVAHIVR